MSKLTRKKLVKGTKLQAQQITGTQVPINEGLNEQAVNSENLDKYESPFRLNFWLPQIRFGDNPNPASDPFGYEDLAFYYKPWFAKNQVYNYPFIIPATQDIWTEQINENSRYYTLREISFSQDQGDEPISWLSLITSQETSTPYAEQSPTYPYTSTYSNMIYEACTREFDYSIRLSLWSKTPWAIDNNLTIWEDQLGSWTIPFTAFVNPNMSFNPYVISDLSLQLAPDRSYCWQLELFSNNPELVVELFGEGDQEATFDQYLKNIQMSLLLTTPLRQFDEAAGTKLDPSVQNYPWTYAGGVNGTTTLTNISPGDTIDAAPLQDNNEAIDHIFQHKIQGGHNTLWSKPFAAQQSDLSAYDVIAVNLFNQVGSLKYGGIDGGFMPYKTQDEETEELLSIADRKCFSIYEPFTIHSMYVGFQMGGGPAREQHLEAQGTSSVPDLDVEVVMHSGWRSDRYATQQIGYLQIRNEDPTANLVDAAVDPVVQSNSRENSANFAIGSPSLVLYQVSLNGTQTPPPAFYNQGTPYYVGRGIGFNSDDRSRITDSANNSAEPKTKGLEKLIEVRVKWMGQVEPPPFVPTPPPPSVVIPVQADPSSRPIGISAPGICVYLIVKKSLTKSEW